MMEDINGELTVELDSLISLVAKSLYSDPLTCVRELLANAMDALTRKRHEKNAGRLKKDDGKYECYIHYDTTSSKLVVRDTGYGLDIDEMRNVLTKIGASGTRALKEGGSGDQELLRNLIGQFGIGILSSWVLSKRITVTSKRPGAAHGAVFECDDNGKYSIKEAVVTFEGTQVELHVEKREHHKLLVEELEARIKLYGLLLPFPILDNFRAKQYNTTTKPWEGHHDSRALETLLVERYGIKKPLYTFAIGPGSGLNMGGIVYVPDDPAFLNPNTAADLYVRGMLVRRQAQQILPPGALFLDAIVECGNLVPIMSREDVLKDTVFSQFKAELHRQTLQGLAALGDPEWGSVLDAIVRMHGKQLKNLLHHDQSTFDCAGKRQTTLFSCLAPSLKFPISGAASSLSLSQYVENLAARADPKERDKIYYSADTRSPTSFQIDRVMSEKELIVLLLSDPGEQSFDKRLLTQFAAEKKLQLVPAESRADIFEPLRDPKWQPLEHLFRAVVPGSIVPNDIDMEKLEFRVTKFEPKDVPLLWLRPTHGDVERDIADLESNSETTSIQKQVLALARKQLQNDKGAAVWFVNANNELIQEIAALKPNQLTSEATFLVVRDLIHLALEYSGFGFGTHALRLLRDERIKLLRAALRNLEGMAEFLKDADHIAGRTRVPVA
jgi:molecular chaperone HtpG